MLPTSMLPPSMLPTSMLPTSPLQTTTQSEKLSSDIWIPVVSVFAALLVVICVGYIIYKNFPKFKCIRSNPKTHKTSKTMKNRELSERSYELPYSVDINNEYE